MSLTSDPIVVLVVDDDRKLTALLRIYLVRDGFRVVTADDGVHALDLVAQYHPGFIILDVMLPRMDGLTVCRILRERSRVPILMLSAKVEEEDRLRGLSAGADGYLTKPFSPRELIARMRAILRRTTPQRDGPVLEHGTLLMRVDRHEVSIDGRPLPLTAMEFKLLQAFLESPGQVFTREQLLAHVHPFTEAEVEERTIDAHIGKLREKLADDPVHPQYIQTVRGVGYKMPAGQPGVQDARSDTRVPVPENDGAERGGGVPGVSVYRHGIAGRP